MGMKFFALSLGLLMAALVFHSPASLFAWAVNATIAPYSQNLEEEVQNISEWKPPHEFLEKFHFALSGKDNDGSPVWTYRMGQWDIKAAVEKYGEDLMRKFFFQMLKKIHGPPKSFPNAKDYVVVVDMKGYDMDQFMNQKALRVIVNKGSQFAFLQNSGTSKAKKVYIFNVNSLFRRAFSLALPLLGKTADIFELIGPDRAEWSQTLYKQIPQDQLPLWAGGLPSHEPLEYYGVKSSKAALENEKPYESAEQTTTDSNLQE